MSDASIFLFSACQHGVGHDVSIQRVPDEACTSRSTVLFNFALLPHSAARRETMESSPSKHNPLVFALELDGFLGF
jgi:hypothetical protein